MKKLYSAILLAGIMFYFSCHKNYNSVTTPEVNVYVAGREDSAGVAVAKYWKNGNPVKLGDGLHNEYAYNIVVDGDDVYVAGAGFGGTPIGDKKLWKNGSSVTFPPNARIYGIVASHGDVYLPGSEYNGVKYVAKYWKNGNAVTLTDGSKDATAYAIAISGNDVYVLGKDGAIDKYWKNGSPVNLTDGLRTIGLVDIAVSGNNVCVAGAEDNGTTRIAKYWINGTWVNLTDGSQDAFASDIAMSGDDVYVVGQEGTVSKYWKNGIGVPIGSSGNGSSVSRVTSIAVSENDVYVAGWEDFGNSFFAIAKYWKNGRAVNLTDGSTLAAGYSIFLSAR